MSENTKHLSKQSLERLNKTRELHESIGKDVRASEQDEASNTALTPSFGQTTNQLTRALSALQRSPGKFMQLPDSPSLRVEVVQVRPVDHVLLHKKHKGISRRTFIIGGLLSLAGLAGAGFIAGRRQQQENSSSSTATTPPASPEGSKTLPREFTHNFTTLSGGGGILAARHIPDGHTLEVFVANGTQLTSQSIGLFRSLNDRDAYINGHTQNGNIQIDSGNTLYNNDIPLGEQGQSADALIIIANQDGSTVKSDQYVIRVVPTNEVSKTNLDILSKTKFQGIDMPPAKPNYTFTKPGDQHFA